jgi:hypothetical protein
MNQNLFAPSREVIKAALKQTRDMLRKLPDQQKSKSSFFDSFPIEITEDELLLSEYLRIISTTVAVIVSPFDWATAKKKLYELKVPDSAVEIITELHKEMPKDMKNRPAYIEFESMVLAALITMGCKELTAPVRDSKIVDEIFKFAKKKKPQE